MSKKIKIGAIKELAGGGKDSPVLTASDIDFLKSRGVKDIGCKQPLLIFPKDDEETAGRVRSIADKFLWPVVRFVRRIMDFPEGYVKPVRKLPESEKCTRVHDSKRNKKTDLSVSTDLTQKQQAVQDPDEVIREAESEGLKNGTYKLTFPGIFDDMDDDDESERMIIRNAFSRLTGKRL